MKKSLNRIKSSLAALWLATLTLFTKAMGQWKTEFTYWVLDPQEVTVRNSVFSDSKMYMLIKITQWLFVWLIFIIWIINLIKIKKTGDKVQRKKRIRITIIIMSILVILLVAAFLIPTLLLK